VYHVFARGNERRFIFRDDRDRKEYLRLLGETIRRYEWRLLAYCLMGNHVHLLVETPRPNLADGMQWLHGQYARYFNDRYDRCGHLFQGRYKAVLQRTDEQLLQALRYIALNPVADGLCASPSDYAWSSCRGVTAGEDPLIDIGRLCWFLDASDPIDGVRRYTDLIGGRDLRELERIT